MSWATASRASAHPFPTPRPVLHLFVHLGDCHTGTSGSVASRFLLPPGGPAGVESERKFHLAKIRNYRSVCQAVGFGARRNMGHDESPNPARERPMRADALKNRQRILDAAAAVFADQGVSVPIDVVAERAGVGVGTLYRHFPTKEALFEAIVASKIADLVVAARAAIEAPDPGLAFFDFVRLLASEAAVKADILDVLDSAGIDIKSPRRRPRQGARGGDRGAPGPGGPLRRGAGRRRGQRRPRARHRHLPRRPPRRPQHGRDPAPDRDPL